jgi:hypothetical protein
MKEAGFTSFDILDEKSYLEMEVQPQSQQENKKDYKYYNKSY